MRKLLLTTLGLVFALNAYADPETDSVMTLLYDIIGRKEACTVLKEQRIADIRKQLETPGLTSSQRYDINRRLADEYNPFISDSAIVYTLENLDIALALREEEKIVESKLSLSSQYVIAGMYLDSEALLKSIDRDRIPHSQIASYFDNHKLLYNFYSFDNIKQKEYRCLSALYRDSLLTCLDPATNHFRLVESEKLFDAEEYARAEALLLPMVENSLYEDHESAMVAYSLAKIYDKTGDRQKQKRYLALASIADIRNSVKENAAMQMLANLLYEEGEIDHAYMCVHSSMEDAIFCNARLRTFEVSKIFPIIDSAYQEKTLAEKNRFKSVLIVISILSVFLLAAVVYVLVQIRRVARMREALRQTNEKLKELNSDLNKGNEELKMLNRELSESNLIKEAYISQFLDACSNYIDKLDAYRRTLYRMSSSGKHQEVFGMLRSTEMIDTEVEELFANFDKVFLHLYPTFVQQFNMLLQEDKRFEVKAGELNTELRIFALIRLGIIDSSAIARFLRYSANTIYNYRTRVRNKALVPRDDFEDMVIKLG